MLPIGEIIAIGDELTTGQRLDTNTQWLSQRLTELGVRVQFHTTVADHLEANVDVFRTAVERADYVVSTGGLGPTADDLTRDALAAVAGVELVQDEESLAHIRGMFERRGRSMPERNVVQALFPHGSRPIPNPHGTAPGIELEFAREGRTPCRLFALPGVPSEMFAMWEHHVAPAVATSRPTSQIIRHHRIKCFGAGESQIEAMLPDLIRRDREPLVGITASSATITLRITASGADEAACLARMAPTITEVREKLGVLVFGEEEVELEHAVIRLLAERDMTVATSEGASGGTLARMLAAADNENQRFLGGSVRRTVAGVPPGAIDSSVVEQLALTARSESGADFGLAVSDVSPDRNDSDSKVFQVVLADESGASCKEFPVFGDREFAEIRAAKVAMNFLRLAQLRRVSESPRES